LPQRQIAFHAAAALHHFLCIGLPAPEIGRRRLALDLAQLGIEIGALKDTSAARAPAD